jgi:hypothetical protein
VADAATVAWVDLDDPAMLGKTVENALTSGTPRSSLDGRHSLQLSLRHWQAVVNGALTQSN